MRKGGLFSVSVTAAMVAATLLAPRLDAYETYSEDGLPGTNCSLCHGDFDSGVYTSQADGQSWGSDLMSVHNEMLSSDCLACHTSMGSLSPVLLDSSGGGSGLEPISCMGCHGRNEDRGGDSESEGRGAGLRQHHWRSGVKTCASCHSDADPAAFAPVGEEVSPSYYFTPDAAHPNKPTDPCSGAGEDRAGGPSGLDNDGDLLYDEADPDCACAGDCNSDGEVAINELITGVNIALGSSPVESCPAFDTSGDGEVSINELIAAVNNALNGCAG